jgi:PST family polysaccharide transporter
VHQAIMDREMRFAALSKIQVLNATITHPTCILLAFWGMGPWAIILGNLAGNVGMIPVFWSVCDIRPRLRIDKEAFNDLFGFSVWVFLSTVTNYISRNLDNILIGKFINAHSLGIYNMAYNLMMVPIENVSYPLKRVLFPAFSSVQDKLNEVQASFFKVIRYISLITFPAMTGLLSVAALFIPVAYGPQWNETVRIVQILALVGMMQSVCVPAGTVIISTGDSRTLFYINLASCILYAISFVVGLPWGVIGVSIAYAAANVVTTSMTLWLVKKTIQIRLLVLLRNLLPATISSVAMSVILFLLVDPLTRDLGMRVVTSLVVEVSCGALIYIGLIRLFASEEWKEVSNYVQLRISGLLPWQRSQPKFE